MPDYCSCGAELPPDALFCHKCGKPQREIVEPETAPKPAVIITPAEFAPPQDAAPPTFRNPVAIKIALFVGGIGTLLSFLPYINFFGAGFFAVFFYRRRTGKPLNMESGLRMGWMTGLIMFGFLAMLLMAWVLLMRAAGGMAMIPPQLRQSVDPKVIEGLERLIQSGSAVAGSLLELFVFTTLLSMAGGALGAKMVGRS
jgi:hypothetical protein